MKHHILHQALLYYLDREGEVRDIIGRYIDGKDGIFNIFGEEFVENNKNSIEIVINEKKSSALINKCELNKGENIIKLIIKN